jgi:cytoskeletal protein CcmA (bactofilin family)
MESGSTIGRGTTIRGSVRGEGDLEVHGRVEGAIEVTGDVTLGESALVRGDVRGRRVVIHGAVAGNVSAEESLILEPGARVVGDLGAPRIGIRPGALVRGNVSTTGPLTASAAAAPARGRATAPAATRPAPARTAPPTPARPAVAVRPLPAPPRPAPLAAVSPSKRPTVEPERAPATAHGSNAEPEVDAAPESDAEPAHRGAGGPPPPVVPSLRKGAKAQMRRGKGAR